MVRGVSNDEPSGNLERQRGGAGADVTKSLVNSSENLILEFPSVLHSVMRESEPRLTLAVVAPEGVEATGVAATNLRCLLALIEVFTVPSISRESETRLALAVEAPDGVEANGVAATNRWVLQALIEILTLPSERSKLQRCCGSEPMLTLTVEASICVVTCGITSTGWGTVPLFTLIHINTLLTPFGNEAQAAISGLYVPQ